MEKPPNNKLFDDPGKPARLSPVLQKRLDAQAAKSAPSSTAAPVFNFTIGNELAGLPTPGPSAATSARSSDQLLPANHKIGIEMPLAQFCATYNLSANILRILQDHAFENATLLRFTTIPQLEKMGLRLGEIAALRDAIESATLYSPRP